MEIVEKVEEYIKLKQDIYEELSKIDLTKVGNLTSEVLIKLLKDVSFESKAFELMLNLNPKLAREHLDKYYLDGEPKTKSRFKGNLDVMLDDYKIILGETEFRNLITGLAKNIRQYPIIKEAIEFTND